ncbi:MAG TPA: hypothetical protein VHZ03_10395 [Trebonia sp.]|nr:hypothetical protein [Trebonia sp.]
MASQVIMDDGNENTIDDHLRDDNHKGARSMNDEHLSDMHRNPNPSQRKVEPTPGQPQPQPQSQPGKDREKDMPNDDPARPARKDTKRDNKRK